LTENDTARDDVLGADKLLPKVIPLSIFWYTAAAADPDRVKTPNVEKEFMIPDTDTTARLSVP
jgi:hypothetical protein